MKAYLFILYLISVNRSPINLVQEHLLVFLHEEIATFIDGKDLKTFPTSARYDSECSAWQGCRLTFVCFFGEITQSLLNCVEITIHNCQMRNYLI